MVFKPISEEVFIAFDLETTGLHPVMSRIIEIGAFRFQGDGTVLKSFQQLIDPRCEISPGAMAVNGISNEMVAEQPLIEEVLPAFALFIGNDPVMMMAHNAGFDMGFLSVAYSRLGMQKPLHPVIDALTLARHRLVLPNYRLETVGRYLGLIDVAVHRALEDALLLKDIFLDLIALSPAIGSTAELCQMAPALGFDQFEAALKKPPAGFEALWKAIADRQPVAIEYIGGSTPGAIRTITPLDVIQSGGRTYLSAYCHKSNMNKTYRLDLIASYSKLEYG